MQDGTLSLEQRAHLDFALFLRRRWADRLYPALRQQYDAAVAASGEAAPAEPKTVRPVVQTQPSYPWFAWLERNGQKMLWRAVQDAVAAHPPRPAPEAADGPATLVLDPALKLPGWYTGWDIHIQPGGVWRNDASAETYELGAKLVMLGVNDDYTFHNAFTATAVPRRDYRAILDLGCGFGKSTWPLKRAFPDAEVVGVDLAAPCLRKAHARANAQGLAITFRQADCQATGLPGGHFDLVTSTMLIHEMPRPALVATLREAARLLAPSGLLRFLDFTRTGDAFRDLSMIEHGERNNEPFLPGSITADMEKLCAEAGLVNARWVAFDERGAGRLPELRWPERREWHFTWAVLEAEKPA
ncbi:class I SAM-dependent methyltransferase [Falsiroseomonas sp.]|uniref:class I SAM-dependent methyltransferase n=1 Tax=Falsiroseomonas sp. TaxID=2870721 RepID=UPI003564D7D3